MSIALIADMHGNLPATQAVLADIERRQIKTVYCLGDMVGKGPSSREVFDLVEAACAAMVFGNWETLVLKRDDAGGPFYRRQLGEERLAKLRALPEYIRLDFCGQRVKLYHGRNTLKRFILPMEVGDMRASSAMEIEEALDAFGDDRSNIVCLADTHCTYSITYRGRILLNTGSVGNTCDGLPFASYAILHEQENGFPSIEHVRLGYDKCLAVRQAQETEGLPSKEAYIYEILHGNYGGTR